MALIELVLLYGSAILAFLFVFYAISIINGLVSLRNSTQKDWANIDVLLKQRNDELPNVIETVKGYAKYEKQLFEEIAKTRAAMLSAGTIGQKADASAALSGSIKSLFAVAENYPTLKANENFLALQQRITQLENEIADRRELFNDSVNLYNTRTQMFPDLIFAVIFGMKQIEYFKVSQTEAQPVKVEV